jgi:hypothetical protein
MDWEPFSKGVEDEMGLWAAGGRGNKKKKGEDRLFKTSVPPVLYTGRVGYSLNPR